MLNHLFIKLKRKQFSKRLFLSVAAYFAALAISEAIVLLIQKSSVENTRIRVKAFATVHGEEIRNVFERTCSVDYALAALVQSGNGTVTNFSAIANQLLPYYPGAENLQLAPNGVVTQIVPIQGNEKAIGHDLFHDPARKDEAIATRDSGVLTLAGPYALVQGGNGFIARLPVFLEDGNSGKRFWGFVNVMISLPDVLKTIDLDSLQRSGYSYQLIKIEAGKQTELTVTSSLDCKLKNPVDCYFSVADTRWILRVEPKSGWIDTPRFIFSILLAMFLSLLLSVVIELVLNLRANKNELKKLALIDPLTGLPNKRAAMEQLVKEVDFAGKTHGCFAVGFVDVDQFKNVNDTYGHYAGDLLLTAIANRLKTSLQPKGFVFRFGGDEFLIIQGGIANVEECADYLARLSLSAANPVDVGENTKISATISVGAALYPNDSRDVDELIQYADQAMYRVKQQKKNPSR